MHQKAKEVQRRYEGFLQTHSLWKGDSVYQLKQFEIEQKSSQINIDIKENQRLGKYIERFVSYQLEQEPSIKIVAENIQIQQDKLTLGELDCILQKDSSIIHLEIVYKFYLLNETVGHTEIEHCIGPNRKDTLTEKLNKLKEKQLPLLYSNECEIYLKSIEIASKEVLQQVYFKGQLFLPFSNRNIELKTLNNNCICGFYIHQKELEQFIDCKFYIPNKKDWLVIPHKNVNWLTFDEFQITSKQYLERQFSPMNWLKLKNGELKKFFLVWW